jgi:hypothetical protein
MLLLTMSARASRYLALSVIVPLAACSSAPATTARGAGTRAAATSFAGSGATLPAIDSAQPGTIVQTPSVGASKPGTSSARTPENCDVVQLSPQPVIPEMMIVLDRSGSMTDGKRWEPSVSAVRSVTNELQAKIHFGLALFPDPDVTNASGGANGISQCFSAPDPQSCIDKLSGDIDAAACAPGKVVVPVGLNTATMISNVLKGTKPSGGTPTSDTLQRLVTEYATGPVGPDSPPQAKFVLLVTDGAPTCPAGKGSDTTPPDIDASNAAVEALAAKDVRTYVIGYDTSGPDNAMLASVLDGLAQRGGTGDKMHRPVEDEASLLAEFGRIAGAIASCSFQLSQPPQRADYVLVRLDGKQVNLNMPDGFRLVGDRTVELTGASCALFQSGQHVLDAQVQCSVVQPS